MEAIIKIGKKTFAKKDHVRVITKSKKIYFGKITCIYDISSGGRSYFCVLPDKPLAESICIEFEDVESMNKIKEKKVAA